MAFFVLCLAVGLPIAAQTNISCKLVPGSVKALDARCCSMLVQVKMQCGPGAATAPGVPVPLVNIQVTSNVPLAPPQTVEPVQFARYLRRRRQQHRLDDRRRAIDERKSMFLICL
jgi:hypothetical protein